MPTGTLYLVATPIGNLEDVSFRAVRILKESSLIAAEDTRTTAKLCARYAIATPLCSLFEHNEKRRASEIVARLRAGGSVALVSEAGTPGISDPGARLVRRIAAEGLRIEVVPGPCALVAAAALSGLPTDRFVFEGFLPARPADRRRAIAALAAEPRTLVFYEAPHRIVETLLDLAAALGPRPAVVARELTKRHEEVLRGTLTELADALGRRGDARGEFTLVVAGSDAPPAASSDEDILRALASALAAGRSARDAVAEVAASIGAPRNRVYRLCLALRPKKDGRGTVRG